MFNKMTFGRFGFAEIEDSTLVNAEHFLPLGNPIT